MRLALVTGGASGLGLATAQRFAADGMAVIVADLDKMRALETAATLPGAGHWGIAMDVADEHCVAAGFEAAEARSGAVAVLACFAGISSRDSRRKSVALVDTELDEWEAIMRVNARGTFLCVREMMRRRSRQQVENGRIIVVSSVAGQFGAIRTGPAYSASKGAVLAMMKVAASEAAPMGMTVNALAPGSIDTPMLTQILGDETAPIVAAVPLRRIGTPGDVAAAASYLASAGAAYVTGATIDVNGGIQMR